MKALIRLLKQRRYREALVRLWVMAGRRTDGDSQMNRWERHRDPAAHPSAYDVFLHALENDAAPDIADAERAPVALIHAVDDRLAGFSPQRFVDRTVQCEGNAYWVVPVDLGRRLEAPVARQAANRETWFRHHRIVPARLGDGFEIVAKPSSGRTDERLRAIRKDRKARIKIVVGHFEDGVTVDLTPRPNGRVLVRGVTDTDRRWGSIEALLAEAKDCGAHVLVLPELTVPAKLRDRVAEWMIENTDDHSMALALPGSAHEQEDGETYNRAVLLDAAGREAASHRKLRIFGDASGAGPLAAEDVAEGNRIELLVTPVGSFAIAICKDFFDAHPRIQGLWESIGADWMLVPSLGDRSTSERQAERAESLWKTHRMVSAVATQEHGDPGPLHGFVCHTETYHCGPGARMCEVLVAAMDKPTSHLKLIK